MFLMILRGLLWSQNVAIITSYDKVNELKIELAGCQTH